MEEILLKQTQAFSRNTFKPIALFNISKLSCIPINTTPTICTVCCESQNVKKNVQNVFLITALI